MTLLLQMLHCPASGCTCSACVGGWVAVVAVLVNQWSEGLVC